MDGRQQYSESQKALIDRQWFKKWSNSRQTKYYCNNKKVDPKTKKEFVSTFAMPPEYFEIPTIENFDHFLHKPKDADPNGKRPLNITLLKEVFGKAASRLKACRSTEDPDNTDAKLAQALHAIAAANEKPSMKKFDIKDKHDDVDPSPTTAQQPKTEVHNIRTPDDSPEPPRPRVNSVKRPRSRSRSDSRDRRRRRRSRSRSDSRDRHHSRRRRSRSRSRDRSDSRRGDRWESDRYDGGGRSSRGRDGGGYRSSRGRDGGFGGRGGGMRSSRGRDGGRGGFRSSRGRDGGFRASRGRDDGGRGGFRASRGRDGGNFRASRGRDGGRGGFRSSRGRDGGGRGGRGGRMSRGRDRGGFGGRGGARGSRGRDGGFQRGGPVVAAEQQGPTARDEHKSGFDEMMKAMMSGGDVDLGANMAPEKPKIDENKPPATPPPESDSDSDDEVKLPTIDQDKPPATPPPQSDSDSD